MARTKRFVSRVNLVPRVDRRTDGVNTGQSVRRNDVCSRVHSSGGSVKRKVDARWVKTFEEVKQWKEEKGSYPKKAKGSAKDELRLYSWLKQNLPGKPSWSEPRWSYLTDAFGEDWEKECFPFSRPEGQSKDLDSTWLEKCKKARQWKKEKGSYPKRRGSAKDEQRLYKWLFNNLPGKPCWSMPRWSYLTDAFGKGWETECFKGKSKELDSTWLQHCDEAWQWKEEKGSYPKGARNVSRNEMRLYTWLSHNLPGKRSWSETRWSYLTDAFGEGWETECFPSRYA